MKSQTAFTLLILVILVVVLAQLMQKGKTVTGGARHGNRVDKGGAHDITQFIVPSEFA